MALLSSVGAVIWPTFRKSAADKSSPSPRSSVGSRAPGQAEQGQENQRRRRQLVHLPSLSPPPTSQLVIGGLHHRHHQVPVIGSSRLVTSSGRTVVVVDCMSHAPNQHRHHQALPRGGGVALVGQNGHGGSNSHQHHHQQRTQQQAGHKYLAQQQPGQLNNSESQLAAKMVNMQLEDMGVGGDLSDLTPEEHQLLLDIRRRKKELLFEIDQLKDEISTITGEMTRLETQDEGKINTKQKQMSIGKKRFNMDPKKGIEYLIENGLLKNTAGDVAQFLMKGEGLNKTAIGDYLGERVDFNMEVLDAFVEAHDFANLILVQALRQFLWSFRLPGEAQKIDRMMEKFASRYCEQNPGVFSHPDTCYVLSFSIIMLNTALHNPSVKDKPSLDTFVSMNRGIDSGGDLPRELQTSLYESIKQEPFKIPEDDGNDLMHTFFNPDREGWLWKQGGRYKSWKRRWFILNDKCLYYFEYTTDKEPRGIIPLENVQVREVPASTKANCFELYTTLGGSEMIKACKTVDDGRVIEGRHSIYRMYSATLEERDSWIRSIRASISYNPYMDMLAARKRKAQHY